MGVHSAPLQAFSQPGITAHTQGKPESQDDRLGEPDQQFWSGVGWGGEWVGDGIFLNEDPFVD